MTTVSPSPLRHMIWRFSAPVMMPALIFFFSGLPAAEMHLRVLAAAMLGVALWTLDLWPAPAGQTRLYKVVFVVFQGGWFGLWLAMFMAEPGDQLFPLIFIAVSLPCYGGLMLVFSKDPDENNPVSQNRLPRILAVLILALAAGALLLALGAPLSSIAILWSMTVLTLPVPAAMQLRQSETRLRIILFLLLLLCAGTVSFLG